MADDYSGIVTICKGQGLFLRADDAGLVVRNFYGRTRRIAWAEISHFVDGSYTKEGVTGWQLFIVLRTGKRVRVTSSILAPAGEVVAAVRDVAQPHGIPADLSGVPAKKSGQRPATRGLYEDPGGLAGLRYWDGRAWSPLLPSDTRGPGQRTQKSLSSWSALPTAYGRWTYPATAATFWAVRSGVAAAISAALLAYGFVIQVGIGGWFAIGLFAAFCVLMALGSWKQRKFFLKLDEVANGVSANS